MRRRVCGSCLARGGGGVGAGPWRAGLGERGFYGRRNGARKQVRKAFPLPMLESTKAGPGCRRCRP